MTKKEKIDKNLKKREKEKDKLFKLMINNESKSSVREQFIRFKEAHTQALEAYQDAA